MWKVACTGTKSIARMVRKMVTSLLKVAQSVFVMLYSVWTVEPRLGSFWLQ